MTRPGQPLHKRMLTKGFVKKCLRKPMEDIFELFTASSEFRILDYSS